MYDNLTKLPNRFLFIDRVNQDIHLAKRTCSFVSVIFLNLDNFKSVNDRIGHKGRYYLLKEVAQRLENTVRKTDTVSRFGGDEFMIMLNNICNHKDITNIVDKIMDLFQSSFLSRLKMLPIDRIKIDMQFTQGIKSNEKNRAITIFIINLAKSLGLRVLAEGVETGPQMDFLNQKMSDDVQGFYYYKPMPAEEVEKILLNILKKIN